MFLDQFNYIVSGDLNQYRIKPNEYKFNDTDVDTFNSILDFLEKSDLHNTIIRTKSGGISNEGKAKFHNTYAWDFIRRRTGARITVIIGAQQWVFKIGAFCKSKDKPGIYPNQAFYKFKEKCLRNNIDLDTYKIDNGQEVKETIESPLISMKYHMDRYDEPMCNVHHIDFHSSYPAGLANTHPEFKPILEEIYEERKDPEKEILNKAILNFSIGWMQSYNPSEHRFAEWAHLSRDAIHDNNVRIIDLTVRIQASGREVIGYNTDGIWYRGDIYHSFGEGNKLGQWSNDHINCIFRSKSDGAYEYIEDNKYTAVVRGLTTYDIIEPDREKWKMGDIYKGSNINYYYNEITRRFEKDEVQA